MNYRSALFLLLIILSIFARADPSQGVVDALDESKASSGEAAYRVGCALAGSNDEVCGERAIELEQRRVKARAAEDARLRNQQLENDEAGRAAGSGGGHPESEP